MEQLQFLPKELKEIEGIYLRATPVPRALESLQQVYAGMFPKGAISNGAGMPKIWARNVVDENLMPNETVSAKKWNGGEDLSYVSSKIGKYVAGGVVKVDGSPRLSGIMDTIASTAAHGPTTKLPSVFYVEEIWRRMEKVIVEEWFLGYEESLEVRRLGVGSLLGDVRDRMLQMFAGKGKTDGEPRTKLALMGCHDTTVAGVLAALGAFDWRWPPYTSSIAIELFSSSEKKQPKGPSNMTSWLQKFGLASGRIDPGQLKGWYVRMRYNDTPVQIRYCKPVGRHLEGNPQFCTLEAFKEVVDKLSPDDWRTFSSRTGLLQITGVVQKAGLLAVVGGPQSRARASRLFPDSARRLMENNQSPPFYHSYGAPSPRPSNLSLSTDPHYPQQPSHLSPVRHQQSHPSLPLLTDTAATLLAIQPLASGYAFPLPQIIPSQLTAALYQHQSLVAPPQAPQAPQALAITHWNAPSRQGGISSPSQSRNRPGNGNSPFTAITPAAASSLPLKPKKPKTAARLAREMARKLKHRERRRIGRRERKTTSRKEGDGEEIAALGSDNAYHSDGEIGGSDSGEMDTGSPMATGMDPFGEHKKHTSGTDGEDSSTPMSSTASAVGGNAPDGHPSIQFDRSEMDETNASILVRQSRTHSEAEGAGLPSGVLGTSNLNGEMNSQPDSEPQHSSPSGLRFQPPTGPRLLESYSFGGRDRGNGRRRQDETDFRFEIDSRGLRFPQTESGFRERRYQRDGNRRPGDRRGFHADAPYRLNDRDRDHGDFRGPRIPAPAHDRPILHLRRSATPEQFPAMVAAKRQRMDEEGEAEMDIDSPNGSGPTDNAVDFPELMPEDTVNSASSVAQEIFGQKLVTSNDADAAAALPLETTDEKSTPGKKLDVISMIREAKKALLGSKKDHSSASGDFISLSGLEDDAGGKNGAVSAQHVPAGLAFSHRDFLHSQNSLAKPPTIDTGIAPGTSSIHQPLPPPPGLGESTRKKRSYSEMDPTPQIKAKSPWVHPDAILDHSISLYGSVWLHKEIIDFYDYIKPQAYEHAVRHDLVRRLRKLVQNTWPDADIQAFGSFAAEIYLPTSDMDIVVISRQFFQTSRPKYDTVGNIRKLTRVLRDSDVPQPNSVVPIVGAKVPIIKYKDRLTGLSVDISFENSSGLIANQTFKQWKEVYPEMPKLALLLKHFLAVRKINEPFNGGLGSFSLICMIVSLLQLMPEASSGNWHEEENTSLGWLLMEFLELYGTKFNFVTTGITVKNPGYFRKAERKDLFNPNKTGLLVIEDPNNSKNNISKASYRIKDILKSFSDVYYDLNERLNELHSMPLAQRKGKSVLVPMVGGYDYTPIEEQRRVMQRVFLQNSIGTSEELKRLSGQDLEDAVASYNIHLGAEMAFSPNISFSQSRGIDHIPGRGWNPGNEPRSRAIKEQKKLRRAEKVKNRIDEIGTSTGLDSASVAGPSTDGAKKKERKKKPRWKGKKNID
ncbi:hypothetical protein Dda_9146 [Drechslerella dactyloides]|uniref:polynucleotide adenylyltransferase n=1 Tax=Drechslerella dactyloides TaxID=74499 RepID=A0AAD6IQN5_DREDA|nr:hypothetical protein Dda_9146 [Drechslerella dactyloides]